MTTVTVDLPPDLYQLAQHTARDSRQSVEQVVLDWIQPPVAARANSWQDDINTLAQQSTSNLLQIAQSTVSQPDAERLQTLLALQQQRPLTAKEQREAEQLVQQEDLQTLRKAKALYLLKQRNVFPAALMPAAG